MSSAGVACVDPVFYQCAEGTLCPTGSRCSTDGDRCIPDTCGDGLLQVEEDCDGTRVVGSCFDRGFARGHLDCNDECRVDESECAQIGWERRDLGDPDIFGVWGNDSDTLLAARESYDLATQSPLIRYDREVGAWRGIDWSIEQSMQDMLPYSYYDIIIRGDEDFIVGGDYGGSGVILRHRDQRWELVCSDVEFPLFGVWNAGPEQPLWAVGGNYGAGVLLRYEDGECLPEPEGAAPGHLESVWGHGSEYVIAVGDGAIWERRPDEWTEVIVNSKLPRAFYTDAWGSDGDDVFVVGTGEETVVGDGDDQSIKRPVILRKRNSGWSLMSTDPAIAEDESAELLSVWGSGPSDVFASGKNGLVLHYDGDEAGRWTRLETNTSVELQGLGSDGQELLIVVGNNGTIRHYAGQSWLALRDTRSWDLAGIWTADDGSDFMVALDEDGAQLLLFDGYDATDLDLNNLCGDEDAPKLSPIREVFARNSDELYLVGGDSEGSPGQIVHLERPPNGSGDSEDCAGWTATELQLTETTDQRPLRGAWTANSGPVYAVGGELVLRCDPSRDSTHCEVIHENDQSTVNWFEAVWGCEQGGRVDLVALRSDGE
ncbi:MAG: hypothetical protein AAGC55_03965, partial [Myxococcota bacterium]